MYNILGEAGTTDQTQKGKAIWLLLYILKTQEEEEEEEAIVFSKISKIISNFDTTSNRVILCIYLPDTKDPPI